METLYEYDTEEDYSIGDNPEEVLEYLLNECRQIPEELDIEKIKSAFYLSLKYHGEQLRISGTPYYMHPVKVAVILIKEMQFYDTDTVVVSLLHDTIEDVKGDDTTKAREEVRHEVKEVFGEVILEMVESVTKIKHTYTNLTSDKAATHRKLFIALVQDVRVILIKIADRLHNMRTLHYLKPRKQQEIALETLNFYTPLTHRLGLTKVKIELEDRSLYFTDRAAHDAIKTALVEKRRDFLEYIKTFYNKVHDSLKNHEIKNVITVMHKHVYEIYKMIQNGQALSEIDDFYSIVITTASNDKFECYRVHGILVNAFNPVNQLQDYIAQPTVNWYQSLKTHLFGPDGKIVEVLIRTDEMDKMAEGGIAANFPLQKGSVRALNIPDEEIELWGQWMMDIIDESGEDALQLIWDSIKNNLFDSEVIAYTMEGEAVRLPNGATPIDFAFKMSEEEAYSIISAKINNKLQPLSYEIKNGDRISIITSPNSTFQPEWQDYVVSQKAVVALYYYFKKHPFFKSNVKKKEEDFSVKLMIRGEDRPGILNQITNAIDQANIIRITLDSSDSGFGGAISLKVKDRKYLNSLYAKLLSIKGIKSVEQFEESEN